MDTEVGQKMRSFRTVAALALIATAALAQQKKTAIPKTGFAAMPLLLKDEGCARDYAKAIAAGGLEMRKQITDLISYGCIEKTVGVFRGAVLEERRTTKGTPALVRVSLVCASYCGDRKILAGWIPAAGFQRATEAEIAAAIAALAQTGK
jgi:hypothetical protein